MRRTQILLTENIYDLLAGLSKTTNTSLSELVREAVNRTYAKPETEQDFPAFGLWKNKKESDKKLLDQVGGNWQNFPLKT